MIRYNKALDDFVEDKNAADDAHAKLQKYVQQAKDLGMKAGRAAVAQDNALMQKIYKEFEKLRLSAKRTEGITDQRAWTSAANTLDIAYREGLAAGGFH